MSLISSMRRSSHVSRELREAENILDRELQQRRRDSADSLDMSDIAFTRERARR